MNLSIPLFRAKKQDSDEYAEGFYFENTNWKLDYKNGDTKFTEHYICRGMPDTTSGTYKIDQTTLAIHFPDMLDSQGNKIFASLSEDGKGGDILELQASSGTCLSCNTKLELSLMVAIYEQMGFREIELNPHKCFIKRENNYSLIGNIEYKEVVGIQE